MKIVIPSYGRAENCVTAAWLKKGVIACHKKEAKAYEENNMNNVMVIPDRLAGKGMAVIRNWIIDNMNPTREILMVDDDIEYIGYFEDSKVIRIDEARVYRFIRNGFRMCRGVGTVLWGVNVCNARRAYREYSPFSLSSIVWGTFFGIIRNDLRFDERLGLNEDCDYAIQVLNKYRKILRFNKYHYTAKHILGRGGCSKYRTIAKERDQQNILLKKWGREIVRFREKDLDAKIRVPIGKI